MLIFHVSEFAPSFLDPAFSVDADIEIFGCSCTYEPITGERYTLDGKR